MDSAASNGGSLLSDRRESFNLYEAPKWMKNLEESPNGTSLRRSKSLRSPFLQPPISPNRKSTVSVKRSSKQ
ncbi:hypothetical protein Ciccas_001289 [Cichlidogyrus casuarinus]|uniref:Uncharacterized protein n=1 Tax=Cichlidogyrus casuarinus TaxID=1844966 RepID=A0ABD2QKG6_9PLAT